MTDDLTCDTPLHAIIAKSDLGGDVGYHVLRSTFGLALGRKIGNKPPFRGPRYKHLTTVVDRVIASGESQVERYRVNGTSETIEARPLRHPNSGAPIAASLTMHPGREGMAPNSPLDDLPLWVWDLPAEPGPPQLHMSSNAIHDFFRVAGTTTDRSIYGPLDFFSSFPSVNTALAHLDWLYADQGDGLPTQSSIWTQAGRLFEWDGRPTDRIGSITEVRISARSTVGVGRALTKWPSGVDERKDLDAALSGSVVAADGRHVALLDVRFMTAPYAVRWLSGPPREFGNGFSTGQRSGIHPDDQARAAELIAAGHPPNEAAWGNVRIRGKDGSYVQTRFRGWFLDPASAPTIVVVEVLEVDRERC